MTLNEILVDALAQLDRSSDPAMLERYRLAFTSYANDVVQEIADDFRLTRTESVPLVDGAFAISDLSDICTKVVDIERMPWKVVDKNILVDCKDKDRETVTVTYRYLPATLTNDTDIPGIPEQFHRLITPYVVARHRAGGDASTQGTASVYFSIYNERKRKLMRQYGQRSDYKLMNIY